MKIGFEVEGDRYAGTPTLFLQASELSHLSTATIHEANEAALKYLSGPIENIYLSDHNGELNVVTYAMLDDWLDRHNLTATIEVRVVPSWERFARIRYMLAIQVDPISLRVSGLDPSKDQIKISQGLNVVAFDNWKTTLPSDFDADVELEL